MRKVTKVAPSEIATAVVERAKVIARQIRPLEATCTCLLESEEKLSRRDVSEAAAAMVLIASARRALEDAQDQLRSLLARGDRAETWVLIDDRIRTLVTGGMSIEEARAQAESEIGTFDRKAAS